GAGAASNAGAGGRDSPVHDEHLACDVCALVAGEEQSGVRDVPRRPHPAGRHDVVAGGGVNLRALEAFSAVARHAADVAADEGRVDVAGQHAVRADAPARVLDGDVLRQFVHRALGGGVNGG